MWPQFLTASLACIWPSHWVCWLWHKPNICLLSENRLLQLGRHWVASQNVSPSGGWLSGWVWADSCPGDWRIERWSLLAHYWYLVCLCPAVRDRGSASFSKWMIFNKCSSSKTTGVRKIKICYAHKIPRQHLQWFNKHRPPLEYERKKRIALSRAYRYTFPIQVPSLKCYIKWLALNKPKWASAK